MKFGPGTGLEKIQREAFIVLFQNLNAQIQLVESAWESLDQEFATIIGENYEALTLEPVENINFHLGHRPSLIKAPINFYPNVSMMAYQSRPSSPDNLDQYSSYSNRLMVELMVKSPEYNEGDTDKQQQAESIVNKRIQRTTDAANNVIMQHQTLNNTVPGVESSPNVIISDVFKRTQESGGYGPSWLWQGSRLEYTFGKTSSHKFTNIDQI